MADPERFDADPDPDPTYQADADPDPNLFTRVRIFFFFKSSTTGIVSEVFQNKSCVISQQECRRKGEG